MDKPTTNPAATPTLYLVGTPLGNLEDITLRALRVLREVPLIAAEDTRVTRKLLAYYAINTPVTSYHDRNKKSKTAYLLTQLQEKDLALVSDSGMPGISDPGYELVVAAIAEGVRVVPVPGPAAPLTALVTSGLPTDSFIYLGFLPRRAGARRKLLATLKDAPRTIIIFEAPHRLVDALRDIEAIWGNRRVVIGRELTKLHEEFWRGTVRAAITHFTTTEPRGEFTLVIAGAEANVTWDEPRVRAAIRELRAAGVSAKDAAREIATVSGWAKRDVYNLVNE